MKRLMLTAIAAALFAAETFAASPAATQAWVTNYVAATTVITRSVDGGTQYIAGSGDYTVTVTVERASVYALRATNATATAVSLGVTNGMYFVWNEDIHSYTNSTQAILATKTNFVWNTYNSISNEFSGAFSVYGVNIQPCVAEEVTK